MPARQALPGAGAANGVGQSEGYRDEGLVSIIEMRGPVVVEVCERCGRRMEIGFMRGQG